MKRLVTILSLFFSLASFAAQREAVWPKNKMPDCQQHQIAAMTNEVESPGFDSTKFRIPYLEWYSAPKADVRTDVCMILISGGSYVNCCDVDLLEYWSRELTELGIQCVKFVYRTPRPVGLPIYQTAWEDGQRAVRVVRSEAKKRGYDPEKIGVIAMSAGSHLGLLLAANSQTRAYERIDKIDDIPCHLNWAILNAPAYTTTDGENGTPALYQGYGTDVKLSRVFDFDEKTCPMSIHHGGADVYSPNGSTLVYRKLRTMGIPSELHLYADMGHGAFGFDRAVEFMRQMGYLGKLPDEVLLADRFSKDDARESYIKQSIWPDGRTPDFRDDQCTPYLEWHFPKVKTTNAIQIIYSGGGYYVNNPDDFEVAPARRYLNEKGMTVVTMKYRTPRPQGLSKHTAAWEDLQRTIRLVRSQAEEFGLDPNRIGIMGSSAGGHLTIMGVTSSLHQSYLPIDDIDCIPCNVQWGIGMYPAYVLSDGSLEPNRFGGNRDEDVIVDDFSFDMKTAPMLFLHGDSDEWAAMNSVKTWEKMRSLGIQSELHTYATREHCFNMAAAPGTGSYSFLDRIWEFMTRKGFNR